MSRTKAAFSTATNKKILQLFVCVPAGISPHSDLEITFGSLYNQSNARLMAFSSWATRPSKNKYKGIISSKSLGYFHTDGTLWPGHPVLINMQETAWLFGEPCAMLLACVRDNRWEKHKRYMDSQWNESLKLITIPFKAILRIKYMQSICHVSPSTTWCITFLIILVGFLQEMGLRQKK